MMTLDRLIFFGTPDFAVPTLDALCEAGRRPVRVVTQRAKPVGRGRRLRQTPVARRAAELGLPVAQPRRLKEPGFFELLEGDRPDLAVVVAFGMIFPRRMLELPLRGCLNLHASLLPAYRGAAPIQAAIAAGEARTGVTTMLMEKKLDSGPVLLQSSLEIGHRETAGELSERLALRGAELVLETLAALEAGAVEPRAQDHELATHAPRLSKEDGRVDWGTEAKALYDRLRAFTPWPGLTASLRGEPVKIVDCRPVAAAPRPSAPPGTYLGLEGDELLIACGDETVLGVGLLQRAGRRALDGRTFVNGERLRPGDRFE